MTRRTIAQYNWDKQEFDEMIVGSNRRSTRQGTVKFIVAHHMTIPGTGTGSALTACFNTWKTRVASAHYGVDGDHLAQFVYDYDAAWATANRRGNHDGISIEHANEKLAPKWTISPKTFSNGAKLAAYLHVTHKLGRPTSSGFGTGGTLRTHQSFYSTSCPGPYFELNWKNYVKLAQQFYDQITSTPVKHAPPVLIPAPEKDKTMDIEVMFLPTAGYNDKKLPGVSQWRANTKGLAALVEKHLPDLIGTTELSNRDLNPMRPLLDAELESYARVSGGTDGRYIYRNKQHTDHIASGNVSSDSKFKGDDKQAAWSVDRVDGRKIGIITIHTENEDGPGADEIRVKQMREMTKKGIAAIKAAAPINEKYIIVVADTNSSSWVKEAMEKDGWTAIGPGYYTGWDDKSKKTFDWAFIKGGKATVKRINHSFGDHTALIINWTVEV